MSDFYADQDEMIAHAKTAKAAFEDGMFKDGGWVQGYPVTSTRTVWLSPLEIQNNSIEGLATLIWARGQAQSKQKDYKE